VESEVIEAGGNNRTSRGRVVRIMDAVAERGSSALGLLLIACWAGTVSVFRERQGARRSARRAIDPVVQGRGPAAPAWEPLPAAWREPGLTWGSTGLRRY
jgi:hypothetical protein